VSLEGEPDSAKYKECYDIWMKSYEKMLDDILALPAMERTREIFGEYTCILDVFSEIHKQMARLRKDSYARIYKPWINLWSNSPIEQLKSQKAKPSLKITGNFITCR
jgi:hypothetical protein